MIRASLAGDGPGYMEARDRYIAARVTMAFEHINFYRDLALSVGFAVSDLSGSFISRSVTTQAARRSVEGTLYFTGRKSLAAAAKKGRSGVKGLLKDAGLPFKGRIRFVPEKNAINTGLRVSREGGFVDRFGNRWVRPRGHIVGEPHWDVQLSPTGKAKLGWLSRSGEHINVSNDGRIVH